MLYIGPSLPPSLLLTFPSFFPLSLSPHWQPSRCATASACLLWYSSWRWAWSPRSGMHNLFNPLIIIRGINKFGMGGCSLNSELLPCAEIYLFTIFSPVAWWQKTSPPSASPQLPLLPSLVWESIKGMRWMPQVYIHNIQRHNFHIDKYLLPP